MTALRKEIIAHWHSFKNPLINDILINMEKIESQLPALSEEEEQKIQDFVERSKNVDAETVDEMEFIAIMNDLPAAYMLYIIHKLQNINADLIMRIINFAQTQKDKNEAVMRFYQRNMVFEKSQLLGRIFSNHRMDAVLKVMTQTES